MEKKLDFDLLFKKQKTVDITHLEIFRKAALLYWLDADKEFADYDIEDQREFKARALENTDGSYRLNDEDRMEILKYLKAREELAGLIGSFQLKSVYTELLANLAQGKKLDVDDFSNEELYYGIFLADVFPGLLNKKLLQNLYQRQQFFRQFERLTENFVGQKEHLDRINNYLDWMPKSGLLNKINQSFRNIINWHEKAPLLIMGVGGVGKSTIVAKTILDHQQKDKDKSLPFVYIDFDLPGFSLQEPLTLLIEALRQISIQYPRYNRLTQHISERISDLIHSQNENLAENRQTTNASTRLYIYDVIQGIIKDYNLDLDRIGRNPIMAVFDSFEEMQYRASSTEMFTFYTFIREVSHIIPRFRPVFVGRSELHPVNEGFFFEQVEIKAFDQESANAFLIKKGISDQKERDYIYSQFGGNPLMLNLATDLKFKEGNLTSLETHKIRDKKWQYLIRRILGHIHNDRVRKIAVPGMLVRFIDIRIIKEVLAAPTGLGQIDVLESEHIYLELRKEAALISRSKDGNSFAFRLDLRMMCEPMIWEQYPKESQAIRERAIDFFSKYAAIEDRETRNQYQAEYYFHQMKMDIIPEELDVVTYKKLRPYLEHSVVELPAKAKRIIFSFNNQISSGDIRQKANLSTEQWEDSNYGLVQDSLYAELDFMQKIFGLLQEKETRKSNGFSEFGRLEVLLYQRLNKIDLSQNYIIRALSNTNGNENPDLFFEFKLLQLQNLEYQERYSEALSLGGEIGEISYLASGKNRRKFDFICTRLKHRLGIQEIHNPFKNELDPQKYERDQQFPDTKWDFIFSKLDLSHTKFKPQTYFHEEFRQLRKSLTNLTNLESYAKNHLGYFLKDITFSGDFLIVLRDVLFIKEILENDPTWMK